MGGRGASSSGGGTGGVNPADIKSVTSLISDRERHQKEVDSVLKVQRDIYDRYGVDLADTHLAEITGKGQDVLGYYDIHGNLAINEAYFNHNTMNNLYDDGVKQKYHPSRGNKSGIEAVAAHEMGHRLTEEVGRKSGYGDWQLNKAANDIMKKAKKDIGYERVGRLRKEISGYAREGGNAEAVAEAFADVYCNGKKAKKASHAVVNALNSYF